jgi:hypothetical protein
MAKGSTQSRIVNRYTPVNPHRLPGDKATLIWEDGDVIYSVTQVY